MGDGTHLNKATIMDLLATEADYRELVARYVLDHRECKGRFEVHNSDDLDALLKAVSEQAEAAIVREPDGTPWFITEDPDGFYWATTYPREDDDSTYPAVDLDLPLTVIHYPSPS